MQPDIKSSKNNWKIRQIFCWCLGKSKEGIVTQAERRKDRYRTTGSVKVSSLWRIKLNSVNNIRIHLPLAQNVLTPESTCEPQTSTDIHGGCTCGLGEDCATLAGLPSPALSQHESVSCSVVSDSLQPQGLWPARFSVHGILQARILEWVTVPSSRKSSRPRDLADPGIEPMSFTSTFTSSQDFYHSCHLGSPLQMYSEHFKITEGA